jgi:hypothetical protein
MAKDTAKHVSGRIKEFEICLIPGIFTEDAPEESDDGRPVAPRGACGMRHHIEKEVIRLNREAQKKSPGVRCSSAHPTPGCRDTPAAMLAVVANAARHHGSTRTRQQSPPATDTNRTAIRECHRGPRCGSTVGHRRNNGVRVVSCPNHTVVGRIRRMWPPRMPQDASGGLLTSRNTTPESDASIGPKLQNGYRISRRYRRRSRRRPGRLGRSGARNKRGLGPLFRTNATAGSINSSPATRKPSGPACPSRRPLACDAKKTAPRVSRS